MAEGRGEKEEEREARVAGVGERGTEVEGRCGDGPIFGRGMRG